jgi:catechol 2,3-dioxygenase-like lactoylglutathione lyase family enzyme
MSDIGFTHVALGVSNVDQSIAFYQKYAEMKLVHRRTDQTHQIDVAWISDLTRPFVIVLLQMSEAQKQSPSGFHLGVACKTRQDVDRLCDEARSEGFLVEGPHEPNPPVGYWAFIRDPDGHNLELSYGQIVNFTVTQAQQQE